jgi:hypothetical protein
MRGKLRARRRAGGTFSTMRACAVANDRSVRRPAPLRRRFDRETDLPLWPFQKSANYGLSSGLSLPEDDRGNVGEAIEGRFEAGFLADGLELLQLVDHAVEGATVDSIHRAPACVGRSLHKSGAGAKQPGQRCRG